MRVRLTDNDCLDVLKALKRVKKDQIRGGKWNAVYDVIPHDLRSRMSKEDIIKNWYELGCEVDGKRKKKRNVGNVSREILKKLKKYRTSNEAPAVQLKKYRTSNEAPAVRKSPRMRYGQDEVYWREVKSYGPYRSGERGGGGRVEDCESFKASTSRGATSHEMSVDRQKGVLDDVEDNSQNVAAQFERGLAIRADEFQSFLTGPQSFLKHGIPEAVEMVGLGVVSTNGGRADARNFTSDNTDAKGKSWIPSPRLLHWTPNFLLLLKDVVTKVTDKCSAAPAITQLAVCPQTAVVVKPHLQNEVVLHEVAMHEVDKESSNTFIKCYDVEANGLAQVIGDYAIQTGRERILEKIEQEWGIARFNALIKESSRSSGSPIGAAFLPAFSRFRKSVIAAVQSSIEVLAVEVIKDALMKELRKEK